MEPKMTDLIYLRQAVIDDCELYFQWANDEEVRKNAFNNEVIKWNNHLKWFKDKISNDQSKLFVLMENETPVGQIRIDKEEEDWVIDYSIDNEHRGKGLANQMMKLLLEKDIRPLKAIVKDSNYGSLKVFQKSDFIVEKESVINGVQVVIYKHV